jgi:hypothetical protein
VREIIALFLNIRVEDVTPNRYSFGVDGLSAAEIAGKIEAAKNARLEPDHGPDGG